MNEWMIVINTVCMQPLEKIQF